MLVVPHLADIPDALWGPKRMLGTIGMRQFGLCAARSGDSGCCSPGTVADHPVLSYLRCRQIVVVTNAP